MDIDSEDIIDWVVLIIFGVILIQILGILWPLLAESQFFQSLIQESGVIIGFLVVIGFFVIFDALTESSR